MATNAPYYQIRAGQLHMGSNSSAVATQADAAQGEDFGLAPITTTKQVDSQHNDFEENHNLVELLEAATTAADQDPVAMHTSKITLAVPDSQSKSKRGLSPQVSAALPSHDDESPAAKRQRIDPPTDPNLGSNDIDTTMCSPASKTNPSPSRDSLLVDARASGYTRPPMSKLFMSLNITPENFIALQALAKAYMLSPEHPDRQSCVGSRGKSDTDMVKLRLFNCVKDFLTDDGVGERFFGEHAEKPCERESNEAAAALGEESAREKLVWPRDGNKIVSLVTPLMRRMVTNERQRLYAIDTRKSGKRPDKESSVEAHVHQSSPTPDVEQHLQVALDPTLQRPAVVQRSLPSTSSVTTAQTHGLNTTAQSTSDPIVLESPKTSLASCSTNAVEPYLTNINIFLTASQQPGPRT
ncbi:hypothetical protein OPT61_g9481 [Boeremia exigua]|uniref:Uncharacterized protein n=1 Tax=Boeremia exigua TaxID=749465 RepID=A0ACC2HTU2_9PLEO|nr:hypothetical protein OPT61_g9481 [Boeremia exigua]